MITQSNINQAVVWIMAAAVMAVIVPVVIGATVLVIAANLHIVGCVLVIVAFGVVTYPKQPVKVVTL